MKLKLGDEQQKTNLSKLDADRSAKKKTQTHKLSLCNAVLQSISNDNEDRELSLCNEVSQVVCRNR